MLLSDYIESVLRANKSVWWTVAQLKLLANEQTGIDGSACGFNSQSITMAVSYLVAQGRATICTHSGNRIHGDWPRSVELYCAWTGSAYAAWDDIK